MGLRGFLSAPGQEYLKKRRVISWVSIIPPIFSREQAFGYLTGLPSCTTPENPH